LSIRPFDVLLALLSFPNCIDVWLRYQASKRELADMLCSLANGAQGAAISSAYAASAAKEVPVDHISSGKIPELGRLWSVNIGHY
jgi:hypothetical protein